MIESVEPGVNFNVTADRMGLTGVNAQHQTRFHALLRDRPRQSMERMLWLEANRFGKPPEALTQARLDNQREVVRKRIASAPGESALCAHKPAVIREYVPGLALLRA
jgi:hypothetical protein